MRKFRSLPCGAAMVLLALAPGLCAAQPAADNEPAAESEPAAIDIRRCSAAIEVDGDLAEPGWQGASEVRTWFETNPGDNVEPKVENVGYLAYDDKFLYAGFHFADPEPEKIRAPLGDRDNVPSNTDYGGPTWRMRRLLSRSPGR